MTAKKVLAKIEILTGDINFLCDLISNHTNRKNRESLNEIRYNSTEIYNAVKDLLNEYKKLSETKEKLKSDSLAKIDNLRNEVLLLGGVIENFSQEVEKYND